jgi:manganese oxidase
MPVSRNSIPMVGEEGEHDYIDRGLFTIVRVRENLTSYDDPGWYENPPGTLASLASNDESQRDLGVVPSSEKSEKPMDNMKMDHMKMQHDDGT